MKRFMITAAALMLGTAAYAGNNNGPQFGGDSSATAVAVSNASASTTVRNTNVNTQGQLQGQSQSISGNNSSVSIRDRKQAPALAAPSMSSGHPCAYGGSFGVSFVGGAVSGGGNKIDNACMLYQSGQIDAANYLLASQDNAVCKALRAVGSISEKSTCGERRPAGVSSRGAPSDTRPVAGSSRLYDMCELRGNTPYIRPVAGVDKDMAVKACLDTLR